MVSSPFTTHNRIRTAVRIPSRPRLVKSIENRTFAGRTFTRASAGNGEKGVAHPPKTGEFFFDLADFCNGFRLHVGAAHIRIDAKVEQFSNLPQREAEVLRMADKTDATRHLIVVVSKSGERAARSIDQAFPLVEPDRLDSYTRLTGYFADLQRHGQESNARTTVRSQAMPLYSVKKTTIA